MIELQYKDYCFTDIQIVIDYLRSIGILVPFDKYSVEQILEMGWAVIKK